MYRCVKILLLAALGLSVVVSSAFAHAERPSNYPNYKLGSVPKFRTSGPQLVVCRPGSKALISKLPAKYKRKNEALLKKCKYSDIQAAVNAAKSGTNIEVLPGTYKELPSAKKPKNDPRCKGLRTATNYRGKDNPEGIAAGIQVPTYDFQYKCPNAQNLIAIMGDGPDSDHRCDRHCNLQIEGTARRKDVLIYGDKSKFNVIRADRADGIALRNFTIQYSDFNNIYVIETNGFRFADITTRWSREYGILTFVSDNGLYEDIDAYANGDSGVYPGSGPEGDCKRYGIEIKDVKSHGNLMGYSATSGNGIYLHDSKFYGNSLGISTDSFASGHPGMPQDCSKWENNEIYSNNLDVYDDFHDSYCKKDFADRDPKIVCPSFQVPAGLGAQIAGGNKNLVKNNYFYDNWRGGMWLLWVPAFARGEKDPAKLTDTSHDNQFIDNKMGVTPAGVRSPNGVDFIWDEEGSGNCWSGNTGPNGAAPTTDPAKGLPTCPGSKVFSPGDQAKTLALLPCTDWNATTNTDPVGCNWFVVPPTPQ